MAGEVANRENLAMNWAMQLDAVILGGGPAGLAVASALAARGGSLRVLEPTDRAGGAVRTAREDGWTAELGPHTLQLDEPGDAAILGALGLGPEIRDADLAAARRFIAWDGELHALSASPLSLLRSRLLSLGGKLRLLAEPLVPRGGEPGESLLGFAGRRLGAEAAERLMDPMVNGIFAGDPGRLVAEHALPALVDLERTHGSVLLGLARRKGPPRRIVGFDGGMARLTEAMAAALPPGTLRLGAETTRLARGPAGWDVAWREADGSEHGARCRHLIVTAPPWEWGSLPFDQPPARLLAEAERVAAPPVTLVVRGYDRSRVEHPLDGFGLLAPRREGRKVLGVLFPSSVFPSCAPQGKVMLACFLGGTRSPELGLLGDDALAATVDRELGELLGVRGAPERQWVARWRRAIPQYHSGHAALLAVLAETEAAEPGLAFVGAFRGGVSLMSTVRRGRALGSALAVG